MLRDFLKSMFGKPDPLSVQIWSCDQLLIVEQDGRRRHFERATVEFVPGDATSMTGFAQVTNEGFDVRPGLTIDSRMDLPQEVDPRVRKQGGITLTGLDEAMHPVTWYINRAATEFLRWADIPGQLTEEEPEPTTS